MNVEDFDTNSPDSLENYLNSLCFIKQGNNNYYSAYTGYYVYHLWITPGVISINKGRPTDWIGSTTQIFRGSITSKEDFERLIKQLGL